MSNAPAPVGGSAKRQDRVDGLDPKDEHAEEWRPVPGYEGIYEVSSAGRVRSLDRACSSGGATRMARGRLRSITVDRYGYATLHLSKNGQQKQWKVHRLVCLAFHGSAPTQEHEVGHLDGNKSNNAVNNLAWVTRSENNHHQYLHGRPVSTNLNHDGHQQMSPEKRAMILADVRAGVGERPLARIHGISRSTAYAIRREAEAPTLNLGSDTARDALTKAAELESTGAVAFALEAVEELERKAGIAQSVADSVPAIISSDRQNQHRELYEAEARRWTRLANAVRQCVEAALTTLKTYEQGVEDAAKVAEEFPLSFDYYGATRDALCRAAKAIRTLTQTSPDHDRRGI